MAQSYNYQPSIEPGAKHLLYIFSIMFLYRLLQMQQDDICDLNNKVFFKITNRLIILVYCVE